MELMQQSVEHREMLHKLLHRRQHQPHQCSGGVLGVRHQRRSMRVSLLCRPLARCVRNRRVVARSDLQAQRARNDRRPGETGPDPSAAGHNAGHRVGPRLLLHLEGGRLDREGKALTDQVLGRRSPRERLRQSHSAPPHHHPPPAPPSSNQVKRFGVSLILK